MKRLSGYISFPFDSLLKGIWYYALGKLLILGLTISSCQEKSNNQKIKSTFENWKNKQISQGNYQAKNSEIGLGIPDEIHIFYTDINQDEKIDGIIRTLQKLLIEAD